MMKRVSQLMILCFLAILASCSEEETLTNDLDVADQELATDLSEYENTSYGLYEGVFTTGDSERRGVVAIEVINEELAKAKITLTNNVVDNFDVDDILLAKKSGNYEAESISNQTIFDLQGVPSRNADGTLTVSFLGNETDFDFVVAQDGSNPTINNARLNGNSSFITALKADSRAALTTVTGLYTGDGFSGTFSVVFDDQAAADGNSTAFTTQVLVNGADIGTSMGNDQANCADDGVSQTCDVSGSSDAASAIMMTWSGMHVSLLAEDCSQFDGTWMATGPGGNNWSGTFTSDTQCGPPDNDECAGAIVVACGASEIGSTAAATDTGEPTFCGTSDPNGSGVWYTYVGTPDGNDVTVSLGGSNYDTKLFLYSGACGALTCLDGDDDGGPGLTSELTFVEEDGVTYYFYAAGFNGASGTLNLTVTCTPPPPPIPNDTCDSAIGLTLNTPTAGTTTGANNTGNTFCGTSWTSPDAWHSYTATADENLTASLCGSTYDTKISVWEGDCMNLVCVGGNDDSCGLQSEFTFNALNGTTYYILVHGFNSSEGDYTVSLNQVP